MKIKIPETKISQLLFRETKISFFWLLLRVYIGYQWIISGFEKVFDINWVGVNAGNSLTHFLEAALSKTQGAFPQVTHTYAFFVEHIVLPKVHIWSYFIAFGELSIGIFLILGLFTGIFAFLGLFMNFNFLLAGSVGVNPLFIITEILLVLAWRTAGYLGVDRFILPKVYKNKYK